MGKNQNRQEKEALGRIHRKWGKDAAVQPGKRAYDPVDVISTGSLGLDLAIGVNGRNCGIPRGRITEVFGPESAGKTTLLLNAMRNCQTLGESVAYVDDEHSFDAYYARAMGLNVEKNFYLSQPEYGEQALQIVEEFIRAKIGLIVFDSVGGILPKAELEGDIGEALVGVVPRLMAQFCRKSSSTLLHSNTALVFINQLRSKIGVQWGNPEETPGGRALKHYASLRLDIRRIAKLKAGEKVVGNRTKVKVIKSKIGPPFRECQYDLIFGKGINSAGEIFELGLEYGVIVKDGNTTTYQGEKLGRSRQEACEWLQSATTVAAKIRQAIMDCSAKQEILPEVELAEAD